MTTPQHWTERARARMWALRETQESVAKKLGITQGALGHFLSQRKPTPPKRIEQLADVLGVHPIWLKYGKNPPSSALTTSEQYIPKTVGGRVRYARKQAELTPIQLSEKLSITEDILEKIEENEIILNDIDLVVSALNISSNWLLYGQEISLPSSGEEDVDNVIQTPPLQWVPLIEWARAGNWRKAMLELPTNCQWIPVTGDANRHCFALQVPGDAMVSPTGNGPSFSPNSVIIINPEREHQQGDYVLARHTETWEACFKQYVRDGGVDYLRSLNPAYQLIQQAPDYVICGVMMAHLNFY